MADKQTIREILAQVNRIQSLLKTALVCSVCSLVAMLCRADALPRQETSAVPKPEKLRVLVTDCIEDTPTPDPEVVRTATGSLYLALDRSEKTPFDVISRQEVWASAERLGLPVPEATAPSGHWQEEDKFRLGRTLHADMVCYARVLVSPNWKKGKPRAYKISLLVRDLTSRIPRSGGVSILTIKPLLAATLGVEDAARQCIQNLRPPARVLSRRNKTVLLRAA